MTITLNTNTSTRIPPHDNQQPISPDITAMQTHCNALRMDYNTCTQLRSPTNINNIQNEDKLQKPTTPQIIHKL